MKLGIPKEQNDNRVAIVPATLAKLKDLGLDINVETDAGAGAMYEDEEYAAHAKVLNRTELLQQSDIILSINPLSDDELQSLRPDTAVVSLFQPYLDASVTDKLRQWQLRGFSFDMIPRTTLAQAMDVLSSMASVAGYKAVLEAARYLPRYFPMMITAAGSIPPAKVLVLGAGVAGLQAIATARRLGAMVEAFDTRAAAKEEVLSLGAKFVEVEGARDDKGAGGYAVEQSEEFLQRQRAEVQARAAKSDIVITTAQVRGRKAPVLLLKETVEQMKRGSVIVDLAASTGGNCELTQNDQVIQHKGVTIVGDSNLAALMPQDASVLFSNNALNFFKVLIHKGTLNLDMNNEIIRGAYFTAQPVEANQ
jgi:NAD(P) transhydrogenase subunit alpha